MGRTPLKGIGQVWEKRHPGKAQGEPEGQHERGRPAPRCSRGRQRDVGECGKLLGPGWREARSSAEEGRAGGGLGGVGGAERARHGCVE